MPQRRGVLRPDDHLGPLSHRSACGVAESSVAKPPAPGAFSTVGLPELRSDELDAGDDPLLSLARGLSCARAIKDGHELRDGRTARRVVNGGGIGGGPGARSEFGHGCVGDARNQQPSSGSFTRNLPELLRHALLNVA